MTESGGPTTQAGISYQNRIAALYLGDLLKLDGGAASRVVAVRVEAPSHVDDIVVKYADGQSRWIQVKLTISPSGADWITLWRNFSAQCRANDFSMYDRLCLLVEEVTELTGKLRECTSRTTSSGDIEWRSRLSRSQLKLVENIDTVIGESAYFIFQKLDIETVRQSEIELLAAERMPKANIPSSSVLSILHGIAGQGGQRRQQFQASALREKLRAEHAVEFEPPKHWGLASYLELISKSTIAVPGTAIGGNVAAAFHWPYALRSQSHHVDFEDEHVSDRHDETFAKFDLRHFPASHLTQCILHAGPGFGKSALLYALAAKAVQDATHIPAIVPLSALSSSGLDVLQYLNGPFNEEHAVAIDWTRLCEAGSALVMLDGLDEVPLAGRIAVVQKLERFARRFPSIPWMLTVRDLAVLPAGFEAEKLELPPLTRDAMAAFALTIQPAMSRDEAGRLIDQVTAYPELERLVRIPLFLALLIATWKLGAPVPKRRTELIESYLKTLFRPEEHKDARRAGDPELLRNAMQGLAYKLLESGEIGTSEREVRKLLASYASTVVSAETLFDDALRCGILNRPVAGRLAFPFPIVQEYLAGQELLEQHFREMPKRAAKIAQRPWAQAVQFALEKLPDGTSIVKDLLASDDDAFATMTRLIGRCILNGMPCSESVRSTIGKKLATAWPRQSFGTARRVGQLIDDGWSSPPGPSVRSALHLRGLLHDGADQIVARLCDDDLTYSVLSNYLDRSTYVAHLSSFQKAVDQISAKAFRLYIEVVRSGKYQDDVWAVAALISRLDPTGIPLQDLHQAVEDVSLPTGVRLAAMGLYAGAPTPSFWSLAREALTQKRASDHWAAVRAMRRMSDPETHIETLLRDVGLPEEAHHQIVDYLHDVIADQARQISFLEARYDDNSFPSELRIRMLIRAADLGHRPAFEKLFNELSTLSSQHVARMLHALSHYPERPIGDRVIRELKIRSFTPEEKIRLSRALLLGSTYRYENPTYDGGAVVPMPHHASLPDFLSLIEDWWRTTEFELADEIAMTEMAAHHRLSGAADRLHELAIQIIRTQDTRGYYNPFNGAVRSAMDELARQRLFVDLATAIQLAENTDSNAEIGALSHIGAIGTRDALDYLLKRSHRRDDNYSTIFKGIESISSRLGLTVFSSDDGLKIKIQMLLQ